MAESEMTTEQAIGSLQTMADQYRAMIRLAEVLTVAKTKLADLQTLNATKAALDVEIDKLSKSKEVWEKKRADYMLEYQTFIADIEKMKDDRKQALAELNKECEGKRNELTALEQQYEAKKNSLFADTKAFEEKYKVAKDSYDEWVKSHISLNG